MPSSSKSKLSKALSKRRPRQNIIAMILRNAKGSGSTAGGGSTSGPSSRSTKGGDSSQSGEKKSTSRIKKPSRSRAILQSAVDLTGKLSKRSTRKRHGQDSKGGRASSKSIVKGQKAFYRSSKGISKVTVVGLHHDAKLEPYYTIRLRDGKEKQVDGKHLTPIQEVDNSIKKDSSHGEKSDGIKKGGNTESNEVPRKGGASNKVHAVDVSMTDQMSDSSSEGGSVAGSSEGSNASSDLDGSFTTGQNAYYRSSGGHISKVKVIKVYPSTSKYKYGVDLPDGTSKDVGADQLKALMDLTSDELAVLMKDKNEKPRSKEILALPSTEYVDPGYEAEKSDSSQETTEQESSDSKEQEQQPVKELLALPCSVEMVEAKTEDGGTKIVPKYAAETKLYYKNAQGIQKATILDAHLDDLLDPYYSIRLEDGKEKQTDNAHLMLTLPEGVSVEEKTEEKQSEEMKNETEVVVEESKEGESPNSNTGVENEHDTPAKQETTAEEELALVPVDLAKKSEILTDSGISDVGQETIPQVKRVDPAAYALALVHNFTVGEEVLYSSSNGEHFRATIVKLRKDKKHRPYYVLRLPDGKEKQVYDHRLSPLMIGRADSSVDEPKRSGRSRSATRRRARSEAPSSSRRILKRSDSIDSRETSITSTRRASVSSDEKMKSISRSKSLSRRSASRGPRSQSRGPTSRSRSRADEDSRRRAKSLRKSIR